MTLKELHQTHRNLEAGALILDVRRPEEFAEGHIPGARNIPVDVVEQHAAELRGLSKVYIHCKRGGRAKTAFDKLVAEGLTNLVCIGDAGMDAWIEQGWPVER
jgi:rhodanese-related sulfurtransferase